MAFFSHEGRYYFCDTVFLGTGVRWVFLCSPSTHRGRAMRRHGEAFVGIDTAKARNAVAVAVADGGQFVSSGVGAGQNP